MAHDEGHCLRPTPIITSQAVDQRTFNLPPQTAHLVPADEDGPARLVIERGVEGGVEMMSGAIWVRDQLVDAVWQMQIAHARKVRDVAPLARKTDNVHSTLPHWQAVPGDLQLARTEAGRPDAGAVAELNRSPQADEVRCDEGGAKCDGVLAAFACFSSMYDGSDL